MNLRKKLPTISKEVREEFCKEKNLTNAQFYYMYSPKKLTNTRFFEQIQEVIRRQRVHEKEIEDRIASLATE